MRLATSPFRFAILCLSGILLFGSMGIGPIHAQDETLSPEEKREQVAAERFLQLLVRRPTTGTALDRVFGYHVARGSLGELLTELEKTAKQKKNEGDETSAGNHWMVLGLLQLQRGEEAAAARALEKAEAILTNNPLTAYHHGQALLLLGKNEDAAQAMQRAIDLKPPRRDFLNIATQLGSLYQRAGKTEEAVKIWKQLEDSFPGDDSVRQRIARVLADEGDLKNALQRYDDLAKTAKSPNDRIVFALRSADLRVRLGQKAEATKDLESLLTRLRPGSYLYAEARRRIENAFLESGDYAGLTEYYEKWLKDHPDDAGAILRLARTLSIQGRGPESLKWLEKAIERLPSDRAPRLALIDTYIAEQRFADAAMQYEKLAEMEPKNPDHLVRWGQVVLEDPKTPKEERKTAAAAIWKRLAEARPEDSVIQSQVADLYRGAELKEEAIAGYRKAIQLAPKEPQYKEYLGEYLHRLDRHKEALPVWRSIAEGELRTRENLVRLAEVLHQFEEPKEALKTLAEACEKNPTITERIRYAEWLRDEEAYEKALAQLKLASEQTDTVDDREKIFTEEVKTYQAAGQLEERIAETRKSA
ncbi:MAG: tetratricopeptide repeat protein, partial [Planctomycetaceae bacterium]|nr:tetratricopeptide repeat protein [Planctomycetaceae bacterium]